MKTNETIKLLGDKDFLDKIYRFAYRRCDTSIEAEDLCSDIILSVISAIHKQESIENFYAFVWTIARRVYADYCQNRTVQRQLISMESSDLALAAEENEIDELLEKSAEREEISRILKEIAFLSKAYREVMVMYYIDELKVKEIAVRLNINETTVKQRLFSARNSVRKEVESMSERTYVLKPVKLQFFGTGKPSGNDPRVKNERMFSQNLIYLCKDKPRSAKELSEELCVPMPYVEEELKIQCRGENGKYGTLRELDNGKYAINILLVDYEEYEQANKIYEKHLPELCSIIKNTLKDKEEKILSFPYLSEQKDPNFIMWSLIARIIWSLEGKVNKVLAEKYFSDITPVEREFTCVAVAAAEKQKTEWDFYGCDTVCGYSIGGYEWVSVANIYGKRMDKNITVGNNLSGDLKILMLLRSIGGITIDELSETEKEIAAKALECGYLRKKGNIIEPKIIVMEQKDEQDFYNLSREFFADCGMLIEQIAAELSAFVRTHIPEHLLNEYQHYTHLIAGVRILGKAIEECIREGLLTEPESRLGAEGMWMVVEGDKKGR